MQTLEQIFNAQVAQYETKEIEGRAEYDNGSDTLVSYPNGKNINIETNVVSQYPIIEIFGNTTEDSTGNKLNAHDQRISVIITDDLKHEKIFKAYDGTKATVPGKKYTWDTENGAGMVLSIRNIHEFKDIRPYGVGNKDMPDNGKECLGVTISPLAIKIPIDSYKNNGLTLQSYSLRYTLLDDFTLQTESEENSSGEIYSKLLLQLKLYVKDVNDTTYEALRKYKIKDNNDAYSYLWLNYIGIHEDDSDTLQTPQTYWEDTRGIKNNENLIKTAEGNSYYKGLQRHMGYQNVYTLGGKGLRKIFLEQDNSEYLSVHQNSKDYPQILASNIASFELRFGLNMSDYNRVLNLRYLVEFIKHDAETEYTTESFPIRTTGFTIPYKAYAPDATKETIELKFASDGNENKDSLLFDTLNRKVIYTLGVYYLTIQCIK